MALDPKVFRDLADDLTEEFSEFGGDFYCEGAGAFNPVTETFLPGASYTVNAIKSGLKYSQFQNQLIQVGDFNLVVNPREAGAYFEPAIGMQCKFKGRSIQIVSKSTDSSDGNQLSAPKDVAAVRLVCRYL